MVLVLASLGLTTTARAEANARSFTAIARVEAKAGRCDAVAAFAERVEKLDRAYFVEVFARDPDIAACKLPAVMAAARWRPPPPPPPPPPRPSTVTTSLYANVVALVNTTEEQDPRDPDIARLPGKPGQIVGMRTAIGIALCEPGRWRGGVGLAVEGYTIDFRHKTGFPYGLEAFLEFTREGRLWFGPRVALLSNRPDAFDDGDPVRSHGDSMQFYGARVRYGDFLGTVEYTQSPAGDGFSFGLGVDGRPGKYAYLVTAIVAAISGVVILSTIPPSH